MCSVKLIEPFANEVLSVAVKKMLYFCLHSTIRGLRSIFSMSELIKLFGFLFALRGVICT